MHQLSYQPFHDENLTKQNYLTLNMKASWR